MSEIGRLALVGARGPGRARSAAAPLRLPPRYEAQQPARRRCARSGPASAAPPRTAWPGSRRAQIDALPKLEICAINGVGLETTDLARCRERGITVTIARRALRRRRRPRDGAGARRLPPDRRGRPLRARRPWLRGRMPLGRKLTGMRAGDPGPRPHRQRGGRAAGRLQDARSGYFDPAVARATCPTGATPMRSAWRAQSDILFLCAAGGPKGRTRRSSTAASSRRSGRAACSSTSRAAGWSTSRRWSRPLSTGAWGRPASTSSSTSRRCPKPAAARQRRPHPARRQQHRGDDARHGRVRRRQPRLVVRGQGRPHARDLSGSAAVRITNVRVRQVTGTMATEGPFWEERLVRPIDIYPEYRREQPPWGGQQLDPSGASGSSSTSSRSRPTRG